MTETERPPNILLITTDQQRWDSLGCYGNTAVNTPYIDALAKGGVVCERAYVQSPVCAASRASILTGRYPHTHGCRWNWYALPKEEDTFAHALKRAGYRTMIAGKLHQHHGAAAHGFDVHISAEDKFHTEEDDYLKFLKKKNIDKRPNLFYQNPRAYAEAFGAYTSPVPEELHIDTFVGNCAVGLLREQKEKHAQTPFLLWASFASPHPPLDPPAPYDSQYLAATLPSPVFDTPGQWELKPPEHKMFAQVWKDKLHMDLSRLTGEHLRGVIAFYYGLVTLVDKNVGKILSTLKHLDLYDNTLIIFTSDHGDMLADHGLMNKGFALYEPVTRVPLIFHGPARWPKGRTIRQVVESIDIMPTMLASVEADIPHGVQGDDLSPLMYPDAAPNTRAMAVTEAWYAKAAVTRNWKLVHYHGKNYGELYNLAVDPREVNNVYDHPDYRRARLELSMRLLDWSLGSEDMRGELPPKYAQQDMDEFTYYTG